MGCYYLCLFRCSGLFGPVEISTKADNHWRGFLLKYFNCLSFEIDAAAPGSITVVKKERYWILMPLFYFLWNYFDKLSAPVKRAVKDLENILVLFTLKNFCERICFKSGICFFNWLKITCFFKKKITMKTL